MGSETKTFPASVVVSLYGPILLCDFSKLHECAEWLAGHPIWMHEFASKALTERLRDLILFQHPWVGDVDTAAVKGDVGAAMALAERLDAEHGDVSLTKGGEQRKAGPMETAREAFGDKPIIAVEIGGAE